MPKKWKILGLNLTLLFFSFLMLRITWPYRFLDDDVAFLRIKQWIIHNEIWSAAFFIHVFTSIFLLLAGFTQFYNPFKKLNKVHRLMGKFYIFILLLLSAPAGLVMSLYANGGLPSQIAFTLLSVLWMFFTYKAYKAIRKRDFILHGNFMIRSYALTLSALTLRAWKYILVLLFHPPPMDVYMLVAWLGWVPNLIIAEWLIRTKFSAKIISS